MAVDTLEFPRAATAIDCRIGSRVRERRLVLGISQIGLADLLGLTFQQVQKYEKGLNRIGAGRLFEIARVLKVPTAYFFEGLELDHNHRATSSPIAEMMATRDGVDLATAFSRITDPAQRRAVVAVVEAMANKGGGVGVSSQQPEI